MTSINYVIACWMGHRLSEDQRQVRDRSFFLRRHVAQLEQLDHRIDHITVVMAEGGNKKAESYARALTNAGNTPIDIIARPNHGLSYGSWNFAYEFFGDAFSHYILAEDDYIPCQHRFGETLVDIAERKQSYVCSLSGRKKTHAAISNAVVSSSILRQVMPAPTWGIAQTSWSQHFHDSGFPVEDWTDTYSSPYWVGKELRWYGHPGLPPMFIPIQAVDQIVGIVDGRKMRFNGSISPDGRVVPVGGGATKWHQLLETSTDDSRWRYPE